MTLRKTTLIVLVTASAAVSCEKPAFSPGDPLSGDSPWQFALTRSGESTHTDAVATYRASLLHNGTGCLMADGSYSGYYTDNNWPGGWPSSYPAGWLYPCAAFDAPGDDPDDGMALDQAGNKVAWDVPGWFDTIDKDSRHGLRGLGDLNSRFGISHAINYALVFTSPAVRMEHFAPSREPAPTGDAARNPMNWHWGFPITRNSAWAVSPLIPGLSLSATYLSGQYVFQVDPVLKEQRSKLTVKIACGALSEANIHQVYFDNVISSAYYMPMTGTYEEWKFDGDDGTDPSYDPLASYYTTNSYPSAAGSPAGAGDKFVTPSGEPHVHLVRKAGQSPDFITDDTWSTFTAEDEWVKGNDSKYLLTALRDFPILSMNYGEMVGDTYRYEEYIPKVVIWSGAAGDIKTTIRLPFHFEPMKAYTLFLYVSNVYVHAVLTVADWTIHRHWTDDASEDTEVVDVVLGTFKTVRSSLDKSDWTLVPVNPDADGLIENPTPSEP